MAGRGRQANDVVVREVEPVPGAAVPLRGIWHLRDDGRAGGRGRAHAVSRGTVHGRSVLPRSEEHTSELQSLMRISYAVFCLKKQEKLNIINYTYINTQ